MSTKYLDYEGLKSYDTKLKNYLTGIIGTDYKIGETATTVKEYIDSRIFVGTEAELELMLNQNKIDSSAFTMIVDEDAKEATSIPDSDINGLFA